MSDKTMPVTGGCMCGAVRYEASEPPFDAHYCHCRMCQKASAAPVMAHAFVSSDVFRFTQGEPKFYKSSPIGERGFCADCGTLLLFRPLIPEWSDWITIPIANLDHPENLPPERHFGTESQIAWFEIQDDLPRERYEDDFIQFIAHASPEERKAASVRWENR